MAPFLKFQTWPPHSFKGKTLQKLHTCNFSDDEISHNLQMIVAVMHILAVVENMEQGQSPSIYSNLESKIF